MTYFYIDIKTGYVGIGKKKDCINSWDIKSHEDMQKFMLQYSQYFDIKFIIYKNYQIFECYLIIFNKLMNNEIRPIWYKILNTKEIKIKKIDNINYNIKTYNIDKKELKSYNIELEYFKETTDLLYEKIRSKKPKTIKNKIKRNIKISEINNLLK